MKLTAQLDRRLAPAAENGSADTIVRYLRIQIFVPERQGPETRLPLNLALVIDRSGSMDGPKLDRAREAAIFCLRNLTAADRAAVVAYDDEVRVISPSRALSPEAKNTIISEVRAIRSGGMTNLGGGWLTGAGEAARYQHETNFLSRAILLSDGLANVGITDPGQLAGHADELRRRGVSTSTIGIGADFNEQLLEQMALKGGGHFYFVETAKQIPDVLLRELGEVLSTCARRVELVLETPEGVHAHLLNGFEVSRHGKRFDVRLDDMIAGEVVSLVFRLEIKPGALGSALPFRLSFTYTDAETGATHTLENEEASLTYANEPLSRDEQPNVSVLEDAKLLESARAREEALKLDAQGMYDRSSALLADAAADLAAFAPASPALAAEMKELENTSHEAMGGFSAIRRKGIHYQQSARKQSRRT